MFQLYMFGPGERRWRAVDLLCSEDDERIAAEHSGQRVIEVWLGARLVHFPKTSTDRRAGRACD